MKKANLWPISVCLIVSLCLLLGCTAQTPNSADATEAYAQQSTSLPHDPAPRGDGKPFTIAYVDTDNYQPTSTMWYYVIQSLRKDGWLLCEEPPFDPDTVDAKKLADWLAATDTGPYLKFDAGHNYYIAEQGEEYCADSIREGVAAGTIDMLFAMGSATARYCKSLELDVPLMIYGTVDPVGSGLIASIEDSGGKNLWAHVDPLAFQRQLKYYHDLFAFENIGILYYDDVIAPMGDYRMCAEANGFTLTEYAIELPQTPAEREAYYIQLQQLLDTMLFEDHVDAFLLTTNLVADTSRLPHMLDNFYRAGVPTFAQVGENHVKDGILMLLSPRDYMGIAPFCAYAVEAVLRGAEPRQVPQEYMSSPFLALNLDVAEKTGYEPDFKLLLACGKIYASVSEE